jgi:hypothetical protein
VNKVGGAIGPEGGSNWPANLDSATYGRVRPMPERSPSPCVISTVLHRPETIATAAWRTWIQGSSLSWQTCPATTIEAARIAAQALNRAAEAVAL